MRTNEVSSNVNKLNQPRGEGGRGLEIGDGRTGGICGRGDETWGKMREGPGPGRIINYRADNFTL